MSCLTDHCRNPSLSSSIGSDLHEHLFLRFGPVNFLYCVYLTRSFCSRAWKLLIVTYYTSSVLSREYWSSSSDFLRRVRHLIVGILVGLSWLSKFWIHICFLPYRLMTIAISVNSMSWLCLSVIWSFLLSFLHETVSLIFGESWIFDVHLSVMLIRVTPYPL